MAVVESVTKVKCDRCGITKTRGMVKVSEETFSLEAAEYLGSLGFEDLCPVCAKAVRGALDRIKTPVKRPRKAKEAVPTGEGVAA